MLPGNAAARFEECDKPIEIIQHMARAATRERIIDGSLIIVAARAEDIAQLQPSVRMTGANQMNSVTQLGYRVIRIIRIDTDRQCRNRAPLRALYPVQRRIDEQNIDVDRSDMFPGKAHRSTPTHMRSEHITNKGAAPARPTDKSSNSTHRLDQ